MRHTMKALGRGISAKLRKEGRTVKTMGKIIVHRFPQIMMYTLALFILFNLMDRAYYHFMPDSWFIQYEQAKVSNAREGEDVPFTVCRKARGNYSFEGFREIYMIPEGGTEADKKVVKVTSVENSIRRNEACRNFFISNEEYYHRPGRYTIAAFLKFPLKYGEVAEASFDSNIYTIYPNNTDTLEHRLSELQDQVEKLQKSLNQIREDNGLEPIDFPKAERQPTGSPTQNVPTQSEPEPTIPGNPEPTKEPEPEPRPEERGFIGCITQEALLGILTCL